MSSQTAAAELPDSNKAFGRAYWMLNSIEMFERLAYFGIRAVAVSYTHLRAHET